MSQSPPAKTDEVEKRDPIDESPWVTTSYGCPKCKKPIMAKLTKNGAKLLTILCHHCGLHEDIEKIRRLAAKQIDRPKRKQTPKKKPKPNAQT